MKTKTLAFAILIGLQGFSQNINNPSFDSIYIGGIDRILQWVTSDGVGIHGFGSDTITPLTPNTFYDASGLQYSEILDQGVYIDTTPQSNWALRLKSQPLKFKSDGSPYESYVVNGDHFYTNNTGYIDFSKCGTPFTGTPTALKGYYKFEEQSAQPNWGVCEILLKRYNVNTQKHDTIAYEKETMLFNYTPNYQPFTIPINYRASAPSDSIVVIFKAAANPMLPTTFWVDELSFEYGSIGLVEKEKPALRVYPNPVKDVLYFESEINEELSYKITDLTGKVVLKGISQSEINVASLKDGAYILSFENGKTSKFLKK
mgnify:CR=1 FL=1